MKQLVPPFNNESATAKVQAVENAWNSKDPEKVSQAYAMFILSIPNGETEIYFSQGGHQ